MVDPPRRADRQRGPVGRAETYRIHVHATAAVDALVRSAGLEPRAHSRGMVWQAVVYRRVEAAG